MMFEWRTWKGRFLVSALAVGLAYFLMARLGLLLASINHNASPFWPATGVAIVSLYFLGPRNWPAIALAAFAANHLAGSPPAVNVTIALGNTLEALIGAEILRRLNKQRQRIPFSFEVLAAVVVATVPTAVSATIGNLALGAAGVVSWDAIGASWLTWWIGDALGALCFTSFALFIPKSFPPFLELRRRIFEPLRMIFLCAATGIAGWLFFKMGHGPWIFALFPIVLGAVLWFGALTANTVVLIVSAVGVAATVLGSGPFSGNSLNDNLIHLQLFLAAIALAGVMIPGLLDSNQGRMLPVLCLVFSWVVAAVIFQSFQFDEKSKDSKRFHTLVEKIERDIAARLGAYEDALRAGASLYASSEWVSRKEWQKFLETLEVVEKYPGINGIGVIQPVASQDLAKFEARQQLDYPGFKIKSSQDHKAETSHFIVTYIEPIETNAFSLGLDLAAESKRRTAAELARDTGQFTATQPIALVQDPKKRPAFLLYFPYYRQKILPEASQEERRQFFSGWIYAPFIAEDFFSRILVSDVPEVEVDIFDASTGEPGETIFSSAGLSPAASRKPELQTSMTFAQQKLALAWRRGSGFVSSHDAIGAWAAFCTVLLGLLFTTVVVSLRDTGFRARVLAEERILEIHRLEKINRTNTKLVQEIKDYGIIIISPEGRVTSWNDGAKAITGYEEGEILGSSSSKFYPNSANEGQQSAEHNLREASRLGRLETENWRVRKDGTLFLANVIYTRFDDAEGKIKGFSKVFRDVTKDREREHQQLTSLASLRLASAASKMGFFYIDTMANKLEISEELRQVLGLPLNGDRDHDRNMVVASMDQEFRGPFKELLSKFYSGEIAEMDFEHPMLSPVHGKIWLRQFMHASVKDEQGRPIFVVAFMQNISAQRVASERLQQSERRLTYALEGSNDGLWDWNLKTGEYYVSEKLAERFGGPSVVAINGPEDMRSIHPDDLPKVVSSIKAHWKGDVPLHECEARVKMLDGEWCWFLTRGKVSERDETGEPLRMTGVYIDITALKRAEEAARAARQALEKTQEEIIRQNGELLAATAAKSQFLATMSHEIRTPLNGVLGMADLLADTPLDQDQQGLVRIIQQSGTTLLAIINDILDFSKIDAGKLEFEKVSMNLAAVVEGQVELLFPKARQQGLILNCFIEPGVPLKRLGDSGRLSQILLNLIGNAIKFTATGSVNVVVSESKAQGAVPRIRCEIRDTGIGLSPEQIADLFQPFKQADSSTSRKFGGTGLGLSISKGLVEAMGGTIGVQSEIGRGSTFWFELPLPLATDAESPRSFAGYLDQQSGSVAVVIRDASTAQLACRYVESWGMKTRAYSSWGELLADKDQALVVVAEAAEFPMTESSFPWNKEQDQPGPAVILIHDLRAANHERTGDGVDANLQFPLVQSSLFNAIVSVLNPKAKEAKAIVPPPKVVQPRSARILVAEDNAINQVLVKRLLENMGYSCQLASNGIEVLEALKQAQYDLILMDCQMPILDGYETTRRIRLSENGQTPIPIVAVTANAMAGDERPCFEAGMDDYLTKPLKRAQLEEKLQRWLEPGNPDSQKKVS